MKKKVEMLNPQASELANKLEELKKYPLPALLSYFQTKKDEIEHLNQQAQQKAHEYKYLMKQVFGLCDGEPLDTLSLINALACIKENPHE